MPRTITIDNVETRQIQLALDEQGNLNVSAEFHLKTGNQVIKVEYQNITLRLTGVRRTAALALFNAVAQDIAATELP